MANIKMWDVVEPGTKVRFTRKSSKYSWVQQEIDRMVSANPSRVFTVKHIERPGTYSRLIYLEEYPFSLSCKDFAVINTRLDFTSEDLEGLLND